jgi:Tetratricopeptide repeat/NAD:arginine ADP-ribosyltransferase
VWIDETIDPSDRNWKRMLDEMKTVVNTVQVFTNVDECHSYIRTMEKTRALVISSGSLGRDIVPKIHGLAQADAIYIFCGDRSRHTEWTQEWTKIKGVHTKLRPIREAIEATVKHISYNDIAISFVSPAQLQPTSHLDQLEPSFMYTQLFKNAFLAIEYDNESMVKFAAYCRDHYQSNLSELTVVNEFATAYEPNKAIWWYTRQSFLYRMLNHSLRCMEADIMVDMGFFIRDLHHRLDRLHREQLPGYRGKPFTVYRSQGLSTDDFQKMSQSRGGLISFNNFLSTSTDPSVTENFTALSEGQPDTVTVLFVMTIDPAVTNMPYANIKEESEFHGESEILFSMHSVFRIDSIDSLPDKSGTYRVQLKLTSDDDQQLRRLTDRFEEEIESTEGWHRVGQLLIRVNQLSKALEVFNHLLDLATSDTQRATYYFNIVLVYKNMGEYPKALSYYEKALAIDETALPVNHPSLATSYNNIGLVYDNMREYPKALSFLERALKIRKLSLGDGHPDTKSVMKSIERVKKQL